MHRPSLIETKSLISLFSLAALIPTVSADTLYWGQTTYSVDTTYSGTSSTASNWYTDAAGTLVSGTAPVLGDDLVFNTTPANTTGGTVIVDESIEFNSFTFNSSGSTTFTHDDGSNRNISLGSGGITLNAGSGVVNIGISSAKQLAVRLSESQTWTNNSSNDLNVRFIGADAGSGAMTLTLSANGAGDIYTPFKVTDSDTDPMAIVVDSAGTGLVKLNSATGASAYRGGTTILRGGLQATSSLGNGDVVMGNTTGSFDAELSIKTSSFANDLTVRAGSSGTKTLSNIYTAGTADISGNIILNDDLTFSTIGVAIVSGDISGTGDLLKVGGNDLTLSGSNTFTGDLTIDDGALTLDAAGSLTFAIGANGVNNQINGTTTDSVILDGTFNFDLTGASLVDGNTWTIVMASDESYGENFDIAGFTEDADVWTNGAGFTFTEASGVLAYAIPEPTTTALLLGIGMTFFTLGKRRRNGVPSN